MDYARCMSIVSRMDELQSELRAQLDVNPSEPGASRKRREVLRRRCDELVTCAYALSTETDREENEEAELRDRKEEAERRDWKRQR